MNAAVEREVRRAVREAQAAGRREAFAALGEVLLKAIVPALVGRAPAAVGHAESPPVTPADPLATLLKSLSPETAEERLAAESARLGLSGQLRHVKAYESEEYERLLADVTDLWELERLTKADRSHLVRKVIRNRLGHRQVVWVKPEEGEEPQRGASRGQADHEGREEGGQAKLTREQAAESRTLVARAVEDPNSLNPEQLKELGRHVNAITKEEAKGLLRVLGQKLSGDQMAVAQRLVDAVRAGRQKGRGVGDALERAGTKISGQYGVWGQAVGGTGGKPEAKRDEFPKRGVGTGEEKEEEKPAGDSTNQVVPATEPPAKVVRPLRDLPEDSPRQKQVADALAAHGLPEDFAADVFSNAADAVKASGVSWPEAMNAAAKRIAANEKKVERNAGKWADQSKLHDDTRAMLEKPAAGLSDEEAKSQLAHLTASRSQRAPGAEFIQPGSKTSQAVAARVEELRERLGQQPWQRTQRAVESATGLPARKHRQAVEAAIAAGKPVPEAVLRDYPDLAGKAATAQTPAQPTAPTTPPAAAQKLPRSLERYAGKPGVEFDPEAVAKLNRLEDAQDRGRRAARLTPTAGQTKAVQSVLTELQQTHTDADGDYTPVPVWKLREEVAKRHPDITPEQFDSVILAMRRDKNASHRVVGIADRSRLTTDQQLGGVHAVGEQFNQLEPNEKSESHKRRLAAMEGAATPAPAAHGVLDDDGNPAAFKRPMTQKLGDLTAEHKQAGRDVSAAQVALGNALGSDAGDGSDRDHARLLARRLEAAHRDAVRLGKPDAAGVADDLLTRGLGAERIGEAGATVPFDPVRHESDHSLSTGQPVAVERPGYRLKEAGGTEYVAGRAKVSPAQSPTTGGRLPSGAEIRPHNGGVGLFVPGKRNPVLTGEDEADLRRIADRVQTPAHGNGLEGVINHHAAEVARRKPLKSSGESFAIGGHTVSRSELIAEQQKYSGTPKDGEQVGRLASQSAANMGSGPPPRMLGVVEREPDGLLMIRVTGATGKINGVKVGDRFPYDPRWKKS